MSTSIVVSHWLIQAKVTAVLPQIVLGPSVQMSIQWKKEIIS